MSSAGRPDEASGRLGRKRGFDMKQLQPRRGFTVALVATLGCLILSACSPLSRTEAVPVASEEQATVQGMSGIRYFADGDPAAMIAAAQESLVREHADWAATGHTGPLPPADFL